MKTLRRWFRRYVRNASFSAPPRRPIGARIERPRDEQQ